MGSPLARLHRSTAPVPVLSRTGPGSHGAARGPPSRPPPFQGGGERRRSAPSSNDDDAEESYPHRLRSSSPHSSLLPPGRGEVGRGVRHRHAGAPGSGRTAVSAIEAPRRVGRRGCGGGRETPGPVCGARVNPPPDLPPSRGEERKGGDPPLRPTTMMPESPVRTVCAPPPFQGGGREGGPAPARGRTRRREDRRFRHRDPSAGGAVGVRRRSGDPRPVCGARVNPPPDLPPSRGEERNGGGPPLRPTTMMPESPIRTVCAPPPLLFSPPPFQGGGREGGPAPVRGWAAAGSSPRPPLPGGRREGGAAGVWRRSGDPRPVCGAGIILPPDLP